MALSSEDLLSLSNLLDSKIDPLKKDIRQIQMEIENDIIPRLQNIESCYTSTYRRYESGVHQLETMVSDVHILKAVVSEHSQKLQQLA